MTTYIIKRLFLMGVTLFGITIIVFMLIYLSPIDPASMALRGAGEGGNQDANQGQAQETIREMREHYNLDKPPIINFNPLEKSKIVNRFLKDIIDAEKDTRKPKLREKAEERLATAGLDIKRMGSAGYGAIAKSLEKRKYNPAIVNLLLAVASTFYPRDDWEKLDFSKIKDQKLSAFMLSIKELWGEKKKLTAERMQNNRVMDLFKEKNEQAKADFLAWWKENEKNYQEDKIKQLVADFVGSDAAKVQAASDKLKTRGRISAPYLMPHVLQRENEDLRIRAVGMMAAITGEKMVYSKKEFKWEEKTSFASDEEKKEYQKRREAFFKKKKEYESNRKGVVRAWKRWWERNDMYFIQLTGWQKFKRTFSKTQYGTWMYRLFSFDFGNSIEHKRPVAEVIIERIPISLILSIPTIFLIYLFAIPLGIYSATHKDMTMDRTLTVILFILYSLPTFWIALLMIQWFSGPPWDFFPTGGLESTDHDSYGFIGRQLDTIHHLLLPIFCMTYGGLAYLSRQMRSSMLESIHQDYIRTARAKGLPEQKVIFKHALRNSLIPILTLMAGILPGLLGGSVIIEVIFSIQGMGQASFNAIMQNDTPMIMAITFMFAVLTLLGILIVDILYAVADPRISYS